MLVYLVLHPHRHYRSHRGLHSSHCWVQAQCGLSDSSVMCLLKRCLLTMISSSLAQAVIMNLEFLADVDVEGRRGRGRPDGNIMS